MAHLPWQEKKRNSIVRLFGTAGLQLHATECYLATLLIVVTIWAFILLGTVTAASLCRHCTVTVPSLHATSTTVGTLILFAVKQCCPNRYHHCTITAPSLHHHCTKHHHCTITEAR